MLIFTRQSYKAVCIDKTMACNFETVTELSTNFNQVQPGHMKKKTNRTNTIWKSWREKNVVVFNRYGNKEFGHGLFINSQWWIRQPPTHMFTFSSISDNACVPLPLPAQVECSINLVYLNIWVSLSLCVWNSNNIA